MAGWNELNEGGDRSDESATSTGFTGVEELKQSNTEEDMDMERSCNEEIGLESEKGSNRSKCFTVSWEKLLPKMKLRVLLVESDVSTRQIVAALLRKCSYRVVAASNGLKAWEILKERAHDIDLILTEVDLPSISGYALLTLIMEHEICKNIPVISMAFVSSSFLTELISEFHTSFRFKGFENDWGTVFAVMSNQESVNTVYKCMLRGAGDYLIKPIRRNELRHLWQHVWRKHSSLARGTSLLDKHVVQDKVEPVYVKTERSVEGDFAQRNKEYFEDGSDKERSCMVVDVDDEGSKDVQDGGSNTASFDAEIQKHQISTQNLLDEENQAIATTSKDGNAITPDNIDTNADTGTKVCSSNSANFTGEEIDFMGAAPPHQSSIMDMESELDSCSNLDLSLRSYRPDGVEVQEPEEENTLRHSSSSFFTRYTGRKHASVSEQVISSITDTTGLSYRNISVPVVQVKECKNENAFHEQNVVCTPRPQSPCSANRLETPVKASDSNNAALPNDGNVSQSENSSLCDAAVGRPNTNSTGYGSACGSNSDAEQGTMIKAEAAESNVREVFTHVKTSQREAALAKFRLKRKDRCYDKKVRYESRKMLAEKRPRVKGQFVRQVPAAAPLPERR
ncbi:Two-component response regulator-like APRR5 [Linum grandiflorum]